MSDHARPHREMLGAVADFFIVTVAICACIGWFILADSMIACDLVEPFYHTEGSYWMFMYSMRPWPAILGFVMNAMAIAAFIVVVTADRE